MLSCISRDELILQFQTTRQLTVHLCQPLAIEDYVIQGCDDVSPPKWHLAHTTWFFETFILMAANKKYQPYDVLYQYLFNSYYQGAGIPYPRHQRGILSRPTVIAVLKFRDYVDHEIMEFINNASIEILSAYYPILVLGLHHEQQHQELLMMDIKYNYSLNPGYPQYLSTKPHTTKQSINKLGWVNMTGSIVTIGHNNDSFCYDNELPVHQHILKDYCISDRLITNDEYLEFIESGAYQQSDWWLAEAWDCIRSNSWNAPLYWQKTNNEWHTFSLSGMHKINLYEPVTHVSYFEADAFSKWYGARLPTEHEWEHFAKTSKQSIEDTNFLDNGIYHPRAQISHSYQIWGDVWEWTSSAYSPYPGYKPLPGVLGEYNGKFMSNQMVLRGGSCVTPYSHIRATYRNFFAPDKRWQYSGIRLVCDP